VEIRHRQQPHQTLLDPLGTLGRLTLGAMPIPAGVVRHPLKTALIAGVDVPAQGRGTTGDQMAHHRRLFGRDPMPSAVGRAMSAQNVRHLKGWS
jgi:hypothetical protein